MVIGIYKKIKKNIVEDGILIPSWFLLVNRILKKIDFNRDIAILEIGSGTGCFTKKIIENMTEKSTLDIFEKKKEYNKYIVPTIEKNGNKNIKIYNTCVGGLEKITKGKKYDYIISSLPLKNFDVFFQDKKMLHSIITQIKNSLKKDGKYIQYQYSKHNKKDIEEIFHKKLNKLEYEFFNVPPAYVYIIKND